MPLLAAWFATVWTKVTVLLALYFTKKAAAIVASAAALSVLVVTMYTAVGALASGAAASLPAGGALGIWLFVPDNAAACITACIACDVAVALYGLNRDYLRLTVAA